MRSFSEKGRENWSSSSFMKNCRTAVNALLDDKENDSFRRFNYRTSEKVYKEFLLYTIGRNINKYYRFLHDKIQKFEGKKEEKVA